MTRPPRHIALVGLPGTGKSTVAPLVAARLGAVAVDLDVEISERAGADVAELFADVGEAGFRDLEHRTLVEVLGRPRRQVIATGGGVVVMPANRELLAHQALTVWLVAGLAVLMGRLAGEGQDRPLLRREPARALEQLARTREPLYEAVSDARLDVGALGPGEVAEAICDLVRASDGSGGGT